MSRCVLTCSKISEWILLAASYVFVGLRIYARLFRAREKLTWSDYLLLLSAVDALALIICDTLTFQMGVMDEYETSVKLSKVRSSQAPQSITRLTCHLDLLRLQLLLRCRHGFPQDEHACFLLGLLPPFHRHELRYAKGSIRHHCLCLRVIHGNSLGRYFFLWKGCLRSVVSGGGRLQCLLCA